MIKKLKMHKKIIIDDLNDNEEAIKISDFDLNNKIIFDSVKYYLKKYRKERSKERLADLLMCITKMSKLNGVNLGADLELLDIIQTKSLEKNIIKIVKKGK